MDGYHKKCLLKIGLEAPESKFFTGMGVLSKQMGCSFTINSNSNLPCLIHSLQPSGVYAVAVTKSFGYPTVSVHK